MQPRLADCKPPSRPPPSLPPCPGARKLPGDWCGINLDSRFVHKYGPLFEATYGQVRCYKFLG